MARFKGLLKRDKSLYKLIKIGTIPTDRLPVLRRLKRDTYGWDRGWRASLEVEGADPHGQHLVFLKIKARTGDRIKAAMEMSHALLNRARDERVRVPLMTRSPAKLRHLLPDELNGAVPHAQPENFVDLEPQCSSSDSVAPPAPRAPAQRNNMLPPARVMPSARPSMVLPGEMEMNAERMIAAEDGIAGVWPSALAGFRRDRFRGF